MAKRNRSHDRNGGVIAHKDCETCGKHFDVNGAELTDLTIEKLPAVEKKAPLSSGAIIGITVVVTVCFVSVAETLAYVIYKKLNRKIKPFKSKKVKTFKYKRRNARSAHCKDA